MLLVDDDQPEPRELDFVANERLRSDDDLRLAGSDLRENRRPLRRFLAAEKGNDFRRRVAQVMLERSQVLPSKRFRRRHQDRLRSVGDRLQHRVNRDDRFAGADVPLQEPIRRNRAPHIGGNFGDRGVLRFG